MIVLKRIRHPFPRCLLITLAFQLFNFFIEAQETLPPATEQSIPKTLQELWTGFDPRAEPLEVELLHQWEQDGVVLKVIRYRIGIFKNQKAMMAAVVGYPKGGSNLPGLVQIHGGGQYADFRAPLTNAKRGYATVSIAWAGRINAPGYKVGPEEVNLFWTQKVSNANYRLTTDWGALDAYHAPSRFGGASFNGTKPQPWTLDAFESPRNNAWFLCALGARRAVTFLEQQPEVDPDRIGVYGHSMGGKLTVLVSGSDDRVKAAAPSCGGISGRFFEDTLLQQTLGDGVYLENISVPLIFLSPSNDFHGRIHDLQTALSEIKTGEWRLTCSPHHNHQDTPPYEVATQLWFDQHLKQTFRWPKTPETRLDLETVNQIPLLTVQPDLSRSIVSVEVFYTQDADPDADRDAVIHRYWHHANAERQGDVWVAELPLSSADEALWTYANITYQLDQPVTGAGYYYNIYQAESFNVSSRVEMISAARIKSGGQIATRKPSTVIESFAEGWEKSWFAYKPNPWGIRTHKVNDPIWRAPIGARLSIQLRSELPNVMIVGLDGFATEISLAGGNQWQEVILEHSDFQDARGGVLTSFEDVKELRLMERENLRAIAPNVTRVLGAQWKGGKPEFKVIKWAGTGNVYLHPGISHTQSKIDFIKAQISSHQEPWFSALEKVKASRSADLDWEPKSHKHVERGAYNNPDVGSSDFSDDAKAAHTHAFLWALTGNAAHAEKAAEIIDAWSSTLESISNHDARLLVGMEGYEFCNGAELLKHTWGEWPRRSQDQFASMLRNIFYPVIKEFYPSANGNWDASMLQTMLAMGVYLDDPMMFDRAIDYYMNGRGNGAVRHYFKPSGQCQETGRDQGHTQMGLDYLANTCEIAWNQNVDLYAAFGNRLLKGFEYTAKYNLGFEVPYEPYRSYQGRYHYRKISDKARGRLRPMYEKVFHHYHHRLGMDAPYTLQALMELRQGSGSLKSRNRRSSASDTLMFAGIPESFEE